jgi:predicted HTH domain antitoxin
MITPKSFVEAKLYRNEEAVIQDALRHLLRSRPDLKIQLAVYQYEEGNASIEKAAHMAGVSWAQMKDILKEKGVPLRLGVETIDEALEDARHLREELISS